MQLFSSKQAKCKFDLQVALKRQQAAEDAIALGLRTISQSPKLAGNTVSSQSLTNSEDDESLASNNSTTNSNCK